MHVWGRANHSFSLTWSSDCAVSRLAHRKPHTHTPRHPQDRTSRLLQHQRLVYIEAAGGDRLRQVAAHVHVAADRIRSGGVGADRRPPPVAGGDLLRRLVVEEGIGAVANDATARHRRRAARVVDAAAVGGHVGSDVASIHRRRAGRVENAAAEVGLVARAGPADGAALQEVQRILVVDAATVGGGRVGADSAARHRRSAAGLVVDAAAEVGLVARASPADGAVGDVQCGNVVDTSALSGRVGADGAAIHRRNAERVVDAAAVVGLVARAGPADGAVGDIQCGPVVDAGAVAGCVGADGTVIHRRRAGRVVDAAAKVGMVARAGPADGAVLDIQRGEVVDAGAPFGPVGADGAANHRQRTSCVEDTAALDVGCVARAGPADGAAVLDVQRAIVSNTAAAAGRVGANGAANHRRRAGLV